MNEHYPFTNPPLPYAYDALEPYIDAKTMELHHDKHLQAYVDNLNNALKNYPDYQQLSLEQLLLYIFRLPADIRIPVWNNAGGVFNHIFYFSQLAPPETIPTVIPQPLLSALNHSFGSMDGFKKALSDAALSVFGSGYAWLVLTPVGKLEIITTANQDTPLPLGLCPVLNLDVWEHAYYLKHFNVRADYIKDWFSVINWEQANQNLISCSFGFSVLPEL